MLSLLAPLDPAHYTYRSYVIGSGDDFSAGRAEEFERSLAAKRGVAVAGLANGEGEGEGEEEEKGEEEEEEEEGAGISNKRRRRRRRDHSIHTVPRARRIHQPLLASPLSSLKCLYACVKLLHRHPAGYPDLILTNGPATSLVLILASTILRYLSFLPLVGPGGPSARGRRGGSGEMRAVYVESWARVRRPSLSGRIIVWCGLCDRVLVQWRGLQDRGWGEYKGVLVR